jgi:DNA excision repair protein ERCC-2
MIQRQRPSEYAGEVTISKSIDKEDLSIDIRGRIDGVYTYPDRIIIDEIKTTTENPELIARNKIPVHWGQAKCYAYLYSTENNLKEITVQLTYYNIETHDSFESREDYTYSSLEEFFTDLISRYISWARALIYWKGTRNDSIGQLSFPFPDYRSGQRTIAYEVYNAVKNSEQLLIQAPTGIGKTMAALFPAIKALGEEGTEKIFFLTARSTGRMAAEKALAAMRAKGLRLKSLVLTAKDKICPWPETMCTPVECKYARGHYDRINRAIEDAFDQDSLTQNVITELSQKHSVCPFEYSLDLSLWADCIICDYNYVFDPRVHLQRYFTEGKRPYAFIIDEAHNLVDRAREMFSAELDKQAILDMRRVIGNRLLHMNNILGRINTELLKLRKACEQKNGAFYDQHLPSELDALLREFTSSARRWLAENRKTENRQKLIELYSAVHHFLTIWDLYDSRYATSYKTEEKNLKIKLYCIDPSSDMNYALHRGSSAIFLSATLVPMNYFIQILGCDSEARRLILPSPFPRENLEVFIAPRISTLYRKREVTKSAVAEMLIALAKSRPGNYLFYFPSYAYMNLIFNHFTEIETSIPTIVQRPEFKEEDRIHFLSHFQKNSKATLVAFAVMGGVFGEGIDLTGDRLSGAAVVGVGLPALSPERNCIRDYFNETHNRGFEFAYQYPGINKVLQAAGRVIRTENDMGVVLLIDERFGVRGYRDLLPEEWRTHYIQSQEQLTNRLMKFWGQAYSIEN